MSDTWAERERRHFPEIRNVSTGADPIYFARKETSPTVFPREPLGNWAVHGTGPTELSGFWQAIFDNTSNILLEESRSHIVRSAAYTSMPVGRGHKWLFDIDYLFLTDASWVAEAEEELEALCDLKHLEGAKDILRGIAMTAPTKPKISRSPEAGMAASYFRDESAITLIFESEIGLIVETHSSYTVQMTFDRPIFDRSDMLRECRIRLRNFFS